MKIFRPLLILCFLAFSMHANAQKRLDSLIRGKNDTLRVAVTLVDGELIPWLPMNEVNIYGKRVWASAEQRNAYYRLRYNVLKVLPYAIFARNKYAQLQKDLAVTGNKRDQKKLVKACENEIKEMFNREIKNMSITQGDLLIKLIDRETGNSSYEMVRQLRGGVTAFGYQMVARVFGHDLKEKYNPEEQREIENIIRSSDYYRYN